MNIAKNTMDKNPDKFSDKQRKDFKTADSYLKSGEIEKNIQKQIPGSQQFRLDIAADEVNLDAQKYKPKKNKGFMKKDSKIIYDAIPPIEEILDGWKQIK